MIKHYFLTTLWCITSSFWVIFAQTKTSSNEWSFLHTDRFLYQAGERIYFNAFISNKDDFDSGRSVIGYLELTSSKGDLLSRLKLKFDNGSSSGHIDLPSTLQTGIYYLKPFTLWMKNFLPENALTKPIIIYNVKDPTSIKPLIDEVNKQLKNESEGTITESTILTNRTRYGTRERVDVTVKSTARNVEINGIISVSVRLFEDSTVAKSSFNSLVNFSTKSFTYQYPRERFIYPKITESLNPYQNRMVGKDTKTNDSLGTNVELQRAILINEIQGAFGLSNETKYSYLKLPGDITYLPYEYEPMETMSDFIKEIIPQVKVARKKGENQIRIRNTENNQHVYIFKDSPLLIIDGYIVDDPEVILNLDPAKVESIEVAWKLKTINLAAVSSLTDNGIFAIYTKENIGKTLGSKEIYGGFHSPAIFNETIYKGKETGEDNVPDFRNPLYWNPQIRIRGSTKFSFYTSDEPGQFIIDIIGMTDDGLFVLAHKLIQVEFEPEK